MLVAKTKNLSLAPFVRPPAIVCYPIAGKVFSRGQTHSVVSYVNFKEDKFSYLSITILGKSQVDRTPQCSLACLETPACFSYNLAAKPDINGKLLCELLPSDKYNNSDKFMSNKFFHHFSIAVSRMSWTFMAYSVFFVFFLFFNSCLVHFFKNLFIAIILTKHRKP